MVGTDFRFAPQCSKQVGDCNSGVSAVSGSRQSEYDHCSSVSNSRYTALFKEARKRNAADIHPQSEYTTERRTSLLKSKCPKMSLLFDEPTSHSLLRGLTHGDPVAWARVAEVYGPAIESWCKNSRLSSHDLDELVQRTMVAVITGAAEFRQQHPDRSFRRWLWTVARNKLLDTYREVFRTQLFDPHQAETWLCDDGLLEEEPPENESQINDTLLRAMEVVRRTCKPATWEIFMRAVRGEGDTAAIAADFGTTPGNVRQVKLRCLAKLRDTLELTSEHSSQ